MINAIKLWWWLFFGPPFKMPMATESTPETREATREWFREVATAHLMPQAVADLESWELMEAQVVALRNERNPKGNNVPGTGDRPAQRTGDSKKTI